MTGFHAEGMFYFRKAVRSDTFGNNVQLHVCSRGNMLAVFDLHVQRIGICVFSWWFAARSPHFVGDLNYVSGRFIQESMCMFEYHLSNGADFVHRHRNRDTLQPQRHFFRCVSI